MNSEYVLRRRDGAEIARGSDCRTVAEAQRANLRWANLSWVDLRGVDLRGANLRGVDLRGADLRWADLRWVDLGGADLRWVDLDGVDLRGVDLRGVDLRGARGAVELPVADPRGYRMLAVYGDDGWVLYAGCRGPWTVEQARSHWGADGYEGDPLIARRYLRALDWWEREADDYRAAALDVPRG